MVARNHDDAHASTVCFGNGACRFGAGWVDDANNACEHQVLLQQGAGLLYFVRLQRAESHCQRAQGFVRHAFHCLLRSSAVGISQWHAFAANLHAGAALYQHIRRTLGHEHGYALRLLVTHDGRHELAV